MLAAGIIKAWAYDARDEYPGDIVYLAYSSSRLATVATVNIHATIESGSFTIPLKRAGNLILLEADVDGMPGNLILDTGSKALVLNSIYFRDERITGTMLAGGITGTTSDVSNSRIRNLQVSELSFRNLVANLTDLGHIENARGVRVLGFFGLNMLSGFEVVIDLYNSVLELHRLNSRGHPVTERRHAPAFDLEIPIKVESDIVFMEGEISGRRLLFCLDTGAESNVLGSHLPNRVLETVSVFRRAILRGVGSQNVEVLYGQVNELNIGNTVITDMGAIITNLHTMSKTFGVPIDGMLGSDFLEKGVFHINLRRKRIGITLYKDV